MDQFVASRGWYAADSLKPQEPHRLSISLSLEASEVLERFQWDDEVEASEIGLELADVLLYAAQLANVLGVDLALSVGEKLAINARRWPARGREAPGA
jgi:dCTP diphosphatase